MVGERGEPAYVMFELETEPSDDYTAQDDVAFASTCSPEMLLLPQGRELLVGAFLAARGNLRVPEVSLLAGVSCRARWKRVTTSSVSSTAR